MVMHAEAGEYTTDASWVSAILEVIEDKGYQREDIFRLAGLQPYLSNNTLPCYKVEDISKLWQFAFNIYGSEIGLVVAKRFRPNHWAVLGLALQSSHTVDEFFYRLSSFSSLISNFVELIYDVSPVADKKITINFISQITLTDERVEAIAGAALLTLEIMLGYKIRPYQVDLTRNQPPDSSLWKSIFGENIKWASQKMSMHLDFEFLNTKIPYIDNQLSEIHSAFLLDRLNQKNQSILNKISQEIIDLMPTEKPTIETISKKLNMSIRTLQRHLKKNNTNYLELTKTIQIKLAKYYLKYTKKSILEIALITGFSSQSSFSNSFKKIENKTPNQYRIDYSCTARE